ncbi:hypothetical protein EWM64_g4944 [Hericium alpestre]|uniref:Coronin n=1 Tax=Hericium alpestre TaxID=135208 RepID=A0A4Y9ZYB2_9AGAM|nr:hypothetical protein EWM64_g4944 [Hericium alpestre]
MVQEGWEPRDFDPVLRIDASPRKVGQVLWHPTAQHVLASAAGDHAVKLWDLGASEAPKSVLSGHGDAIQSIAFNTTGQLLVTTSRDRKIRIFDARAGGEAVRITEGHGGIKGARAAWMGDRDRIATTGFRKMSDRQLSIWEASSLTNIKITTIDQSSGVMMPFWSDNNVLFLAGKGDGNIRYYEYEADNLTPDCEIARAYKITASGIEPIAFIVPRKADSFQSDIFPPAPSAEPSLTAGEFFSGKTAPAKLVSLENGMKKRATAKASAAEQARAKEIEALDCHSAVPRKGGHAGKGTPSLLRAAVRPIPDRNPDQQTDVQPRQIRIIKVPEYFAEFREKGDGLAAFLGSSIVAKITFHDPNAKNFASKADYTEHGPKAVLEMSPSLL